MLFADFASRTLDTPRGPVHAVVGGDGPPLLLVHGFPQAYLMWHAVAPRLAERFTIVELWRAFAPAATGRAVADAGHFLAEDQPGEVARELLEFLSP